MPEETAEQTPEQITANPEKKTTGRRMGSIVLVVLTVLLIGVAAPSLWFKNVVLNEDQWVATLAPLSHSQEIQDVVADQIATALNDAIGAERLAETYLPAEAQPLAPFIASGVESFITQEAQVFVVSPAFSSLWDAAVRESHPLVVTTVTGLDHEGIISADAGTVTLNLDAAIQQVRKALESRGVTFPENVSIDLETESIELFYSPALAQTQAVFGFFSSSVEIMLLFILVLGALSVAIAPQKRKAVLWLGAGTFVMMLVLVVAIYAAQGLVIGSIPGLGNEGKAAALSFYTIITGPLVVGLRIVSIIGLVVAALAYVAGIPALKERIKDSLGTFSHSEKATPFFQFVDRNGKTAIIAGCVVAAVLVLFFFQGSFDFLIDTAITLVAWVALVSALVAIGRIEPSKLAEADTI